MASLLGTRLRVTGRWALAGRKQSLWKVEPAPALLLPDPPPPPFPGIC